LGRPKWDSGTSSSAQEWDAVLEVRPENHEAFHGLAALLFAEGSESLNRAAVVRHPNLLLWCAATDAGVRKGIAERTPELGPVKRCDVARSLVSYS
jgi:hypothetical protein